MPCVISRRLCSIKKTALEYVKWYISVVNQPSEWVQKGYEIMVETEMCVSMHSAQL